MEMGYLLNLEDGLMVQGSTVTSHHVGSGIKPPNLLGINLANGMFDEIMSLNC